METRRVLVAAVAVTCVACSHAAPPAPAARGPSPAVLAFDRSSLDTTCAPCRDFFQFANGGWLARTEIPAEFPSWGSFSVLYLRNLDVLREVLDAAAADSVASPSSNRRKLGLFYGTCMDSARAQAAGVEP